MKLRLLKSDVVGDLYGNIEANLAHYRNGDFEYLLTDSSLTKEIDVEVDPDLLIQLTVDSTNRANDVEACLKIHEALGHISLYLARDPRLWTLITHTLCLEYVRTRWPIPDDDNKAIKNIKDHFFAISDRLIESRNAASRLWWISHLCARVESMSLREALKVFLAQSDVRSLIIEKPTTSQVPVIFEGLLVKLKESLEDDRGALLERANFRALSKALNLSGGNLLLDALKPAQVADLITKASSEWRIR